MIDNVIFLKHPLYYSKPYNFCLSVFGDPDAAQHSHYNTVMRIADADYSLYYWCCEICWDVSIHCWISSYLTLCPKIWSVWKYPNQFS